jgi:hypothetical protein
MVRSKMKQPAPRSGVLKLKNRYRNLMWNTVKILALVTTLFLTGCETSKFTTVTSGTPYKPDNIFLAAPQLPADLKRVAVLPLACDGRRTDLAAGRDSLGPILITELSKAKKFEVVEVSSEDLCRLTGRANWTGEEILPAGFLDSLKKEYGCDAVLFCQLTEFQAYPPLAVEWRLRLVTVRGQKTLWAGDEQFDAGKPAVMAGALLYQRQEQRQLDDDATEWLAMNSPQRFGQYSIARLLDTLPPR